jgi:hypothetical protein
MEPMAQPLNEAQRRRAANEALFRQVNERLEELNEAFESMTKTFSVVCECDDQECMEQIELTRDEYERVRADSSCFVVVRGHESPDVESVVADRDGWRVVKKRPGAPAEYAEATDPRA